MKEDLYKIVNQNPNTTEILLYSLVEGGYTANQLIAALNASPSENINLRINSDGGDAFEGIAIYNYLKDRNVDVIIDGMWASAAATIAMAGQSVKMNRGSMMMIHNPATAVFGDVSELKDAAKYLQKVTDMTAEIYAAASSLDIKQVRKLMDAQTWMTPQEALDYGFVNEIDTAPELPAAPELELPAQITDRFADGVKAERERLQALDAIYTPSRANIINAAKYHTFQTAQDIALDLLKSESYRPSAADVTNFSASNRDEQVIESMSEYIIRRRG